MNDKQAIIILVVVKVSILVLIAFIACLYAIPLCFVRRFHTSRHLLTLNVCVASFICATFWAIYYIMNTFFQDILWTAQSCLPILYLQTTVNCQVLYALCVVSLNRWFTVVYQNVPLFRTKRWVAVCVTAQWIFAGLIPLPTLKSSLEHCFVSGLELNYQIYTLMIIAVMPAIPLLITNVSIYLFTRRSTRRVQATANEDQRAVGLVPRDIHLLKHMVFMFLVFFLGWIPIYIIAVVDWDGTSISYVLLHSLTILPVVSLFIDVVNLFWYNHELRRFLTNLSNRPCDSQ